MPRKMRHLPHAPQILNRLNSLLKNSERSLPRISKLPLISSKRKINSFLTQIVQRPDKSWNQLIRLPTPNVGQRSHNAISLLEYLRQRLKPSETPLTRKEILNLHNYHSMLLRPVIR